MGLFSNKNTTNELTGRSIYKDKKNRTIYYNGMTKTAYVLKQEHFDSFKRYSTRFVLPLLSFLLISGVLFDKPIFNMPYPIAISLVVSIAIYAFLTLKFYRKFLPSLTALPAFKPPKRDSIIDSARKLQLSKSIVKTLLLLALSILFVLNGQQVFVKNGSELMLYLNYGLAAGAGILFLIQVYAILTRSKAINEVSL